MKSREITGFIILLFLGVVIWIGLSLYHDQQRQAVREQPAPALPHNS